MPGRATHSSRTRDEFLGDYTGVAAFNNKVYGVWTEVVPLEIPKDKNAPPPNRFRPHTIVKVGVADFRKRRNNRSSAEALGQGTTSVRSRPADKKLGLQPLHQLH